MLEEHVYVHQRNNQHLVTCSGSCVVCVQDCRTQHLCAALIQVEHCKFLCVVFCNNDRRGEAFSFIHTDMRCLQEIFSQYVPDILSFQVIFIPHAHVCLYEGALKYIFKRPVPYRSIGEKKVSIN